MMNVGDRAEKIGGSYQATGEIRALFNNRAGQSRAVFEFDSPPGLLHIYNLEQLKPMSESAPVYPASPDYPGDKAVDKICAKLLQRSQVGFKKYGCTTDRQDLTLLDWLRHSLEEKLDDAVYMQRAMIELEREMDDGK